MDRSLAADRVNGCYGSWRNDFIRMSIYNPRWSDDEKCVKGVIVQAVIRLLIYVVQKQ